MLTLHRSILRVEEFPTEDDGGLIVLTHKETKIRVSRDTARAYAIALLAACDGKFGPWNRRAMILEGWCASGYLLPHGQGCMCPECYVPYGLESTRGTECCEHNVPLEHADFCRMCCAAKEPVILEPAAVIESPGPCASCGEVIDIMGGDGWTLQSTAAGDEVFHHECWESAGWGARFPEMVGC